MHTTMPNAVTSFFRERQFRPRPIPTVATVAFLALTIALGNWQRSRCVFEWCVRPDSTMARDRS